MKKLFDWKYFYLQAGMILALLLNFLPAQAEYIITTEVGMGTNGYSGDEGVATIAQISRPHGITLDSLGNLYFADMDNYCIRKIDTNGIITTIAGNGIDGYSGDGGGATAASIRGAYGIAVDSHGNLYFADFFDHRVRKIDIDGIITTIAGNGIQGYSGDNDLASLAQLNKPQGMIVDNEGNLYIADSGNQRIRKIDNDGIITTIAGDGITHEVAFGMEGPILAGIYGGDTGKATAAQLNNPTSVAIDSLGYLYIADTDNNRIRQIDTNGIITTVLGNDMSLNHPTGIAIDTSDNLYIVDSKNHRILKRDTSGIVTTLAGNGMEGYGGDNGNALQAIFHSPEGIVVDGNNLYIADTGNHRIRLLMQVPHLPTLGKANAIDGMGDSISNTATFAGGTSSNEGDYQNPVELDSSENVDIFSRITVDPGHIGRRGDIVVYIAHKKSSLAEEETFYMLDNEGDIIPWDEDLSNLVGFKEDILFKSEQWLQIDAASMIPGLLRVFLGYRLRSGIVVSSVQSLDMTINYSNTNGVGIDAENNDISTYANFVGSVAISGEESEESEESIVVNQANKISINFTIKVDPYHIGQSADIIMVGIYKVKDTTVFYVRDGNKVPWKIWNGDFSNLAIAQTDIQLPKRLKVSVFEGDFVPGQVIFYVGYRLNNYGDIFYSGKPLSFLVE